MTAAATASQETMRRIVQSAWLWDSVGIPRVRCGRGRSLVQIRPLHRTGVDGADRARFEVARVQHGGDVHRHRRIPIAQPVGSGPGLAAGVVGGHRRGPAGSLD